MYCTAAVPQIMDWWESTTQDVLFNSPRNQRALTLKQWLANLPHFVVWPYFSFFFPWNQFIKGIYANCCSSWYATFSLWYWLFSLTYALQQVDTSILGLSEQDARKNPYIASMGVYVFRTDVLLKLLRWSYPSCNDFGSEIIPSAVREHNVQVR